MADTLIGSKIAGGNSSIGRKESDFYPTPWEATHAILRFLNENCKVAISATTIWEPACGNGDMSNEMREIGFDVIATDIRQGVDFLKAELVPCDWIITNPPFSNAGLFIERCIKHEKPFALLLKCQYWHARKRLELFQKYPPSHILPLTWRVNFLPDKENASPLMDVMWVVWDGTHDTRYIPLKKPEQKIQDEFNNITRKAKWFNG